MFYRFCPCFPPVKTLSIIRVGVFFISPDAQLIVSRILFSVTEFFVKPVTVSVFTKIGTISLFYTFNIIIKFSAVISYRDYINKIPAVNIKSPVLVITFQADFLYIFKKLLCPLPGFVSERGGGLSRFLFD